MTDITKFKEAFDEAVKCIATHHKLPRVIRFRTQDVSGNSVWLEPDLSHDCICGLHLALMPCGCATEIIVNLNRVKE